MPLQDQDPVPPSPSTCQPEEPHIAIVPGGVLDPEEVAVLRAFKMRHATVKDFLSFKSNYIPTEPELVMWECIGWKFDREIQFTGRWHDTWRWQRDVTHLEHMTEVMSVLPVRQRDRVSYELSRLHPIILIQNAWDEELRTRREEQISIIYGAVGKWQHDNLGETRDFFPNGILDSTFRKQSTDTTYLIRKGWANDAAAVRRLLRLQAIPIMGQAVAIKNILVDPDRAFEAGRALDVFCVPTSAVWFRENQPAMYCGTPVLVDGVFHLAWCPLDRGDAVPSLYTYRDGGVI